MAPNPIYDYKLENMEFIMIGARRPKTNIDRRTCHRVVPMEVLSLGCARTGTSSLRIALMILGFNDVYHMTSMLEENPRDSDMWVEAYEAKFEGKGKLYDKKDWDQLLGHCKAVTDWPAAAFPEELIAAYPDAKVILTVRDSPEAWHKSVSSTIWTGQFIMLPPTNPLQWLVQRILIRPPCWPTMQKIFGHAIGRDFPTKGKETYLKHNEKVRMLAASKAKEDFLEFNVKEGWGPLCEFLGLPVPDVPFPRINDTEQWRAHVGMLRKTAAVGSLKKIIAFGVLVWSIYLGIKRLSSLPVQSLS